MSALEEIADAADGRIDTRAVRALGDIRQTHLSPREVRA